MTFLLNNISYIQSQTNESLISRLFRMIWKSTYSISSLNLFISNQNDPLIYDWLHEIFINVTVKLIDWFIFEDMISVFLLKRYEYHILYMLKCSQLFNMISRSVLFLSAIIHCTRVLFPIKRHSIRKQRPYANAFLLYAAKFFFWSVCHWSNFELSTDDQHWNGCSRQKRRTQCIYNLHFFLFCSFSCTFHLL